MPNWCQNFAEFRHEDPTQVHRLLAAYKEQRLFTEFVPCPVDLLESTPIGEDYVERDKARQQANTEKHGYPSWYEWCIANWGTKWDIAEADWHMGDLDEDATMVGVSFDTAWGPPVKFYEIMTAAGWDITAHYLEEGQGFVGKFTSEDGDEGYDFDGSEDLEDIPEDIKEHWDLASICEMREDEEDDHEDGGE
jgi:Ferredoxin-like domain in Api92-like protein